MSEKNKIKKLKNLARKGFQGYPLATVIYYGPDDETAAKVVVGVIPFEGADASALKRWINEDSDIRSDHAVSEEIVTFIKKKKVRSVVIADRIMGCPHEEGVDYPDGETCPKCPYWRNRDRFSGEMIH